MDRKYELLKDDCINYKGKTLYRIKALKDFIDTEGFAITEGMLGGYIEDESNLSQKDKSWVYDNSYVYGGTIINDSIIKKSIIRNSIIRHSIINDSIIKKSNIYNSNIKDSYINKASIDDVTIVDRRVTGVITMPFKDIFQHQCRNRVLTAILTENDEILYTIGCQHNITEKEFIDRIYNEDGGLEENPHRAEYLKLIPLINLYFWRREEK